MFEYKILILYILSRLGEPVKADVVSGIAGFAAGITFFEVNSALVSLAETGSVADIGGEYAITETGEQFGAELYKFLTFPQKMKAERAAMEYARERDKLRYVVTEREAARRGGVLAGMTMRDGGDEIITLRILAPDDETAKNIEARFQSSAAEIYNTILKTVLGE